MLPYGIKLRFGSCADLREHQGTPLQQRNPFTFVPASNYVLVRVLICGSGKRLPYNNIYL